MSRSRIRRALLVSGRRALNRLCWRAAFCVGIVFVLAATQSMADRGRSYQRSDSRLTHQSRTTKPTRKSRLEIQRQRELVQDAIERGRKKPKDPPPPTEPEPEPEPEPQPVPVTIQHGIDVGPGTVGLSNSGIAAADMTRVGGGSASDLANGVDSATGWPMLTGLDIVGGLTIDVPCVVDRCRLTKSGGLYAIRNSSVLDFEIRDSEIEALAGSDGSVPAAVILHPRTVRRSIIKGARDGMKLASLRGCLIEDCWIYGQIAGDGAHCDGIQAMKGEGDWDTWVIRRCRVEGPWQRQTSALLFQADLGNLSGVTVRDCFLSGGTYTLYTRAKPGNTISKIRVVGNVWADESWKYGPHSNDCKDLEVGDNWLAPVTSNTSPVAVDRDSARPLK